MKYAFVLIHFGSNPVYFEYELYTVFMIRTICNYDFVYMYSKSDTPPKFVEVMKKFNVNEDGEGGGGGDGGDSGEGITAGGEGMSTDLLGGGSGHQPELGVLGLGNFNFPVRLGKIKKRLLDQYSVLK